MNSLEFIKQHVTEWPYSDATKLSLSYDGHVIFYSVNGNMTTVNIDTDLTEHFAPDYYDGKVWTREEFESVGCTPVEYRFNNGLPNALLKREGDDYYYFVRLESEWVRYTGPMVSSHWDDGIEITETMANNYIKQGVPINEPQPPVGTFNNVTHNKYEREITDRQGNSATVDVYDVIIAYAVTCPATQHAIKKLLCTGERGHKDTSTDLSEARDSITRAIELLR